MFFCKSKQGSEKDVPTPSHFSLGQEAWLILTVRASNEHSFSCAFREQGGLSGLPPSTPLRFPPARLVRSCARDRAVQ